MTVGLPGIGRIELVARYVELLLDVARVADEGDGHERHVEIGGRAERVPGEHA